MWQVSGTFLASETPHCPKGGQHAVGQASNFIRRKNGQAYSSRRQYDRYDVSADGVEPGSQSKISKFCGRLGERHRHRSGGGTTARPTLQEGIRHSL